MTSHAEHLAHLQQEGLATREAQIEQMLDSASELIYDRVVDTTDLSMTDCESIARTLLEAGLLSPGPLHDQWALATPPHPDYGWMPSWNQVSATRQYMQDRLDSKDPSDTLIHRRATTWLPAEAQLPPDRTQERSINEGR